MGILRQVQAVLWGFVGIGRRRDMARLGEGTNPLVLVLVAFLLVLLFLGMVAAVAHWAVAA